jgi:betaine-aldehyde dehydrogenase
MNFHWSSGQSCGSTSRVFLHADIHDTVTAAVKDRCEAIHQGLPTDPTSEMGAIIDATQLERIMAYIDRGSAEGARLVTGGGVPHRPELAQGFFVQPTVFADVTAEMTIAREEIFGPVLAILRWSDEQSMLADVKSKRGSA